jgi:non-heme chloroperoxidase
MDTIETKDGVSIFFKDLGPKNAQAPVFHHGWPRPHSEVINKDLLAFVKG